VRRGAVVAWTATSVHLTLPAEELLALEPLVAAAAGGQATASSACAVSSLRHAWVTCELALPPGMLARASAAPDERARRVVALRAALAELAMAPRPELAPSLRAAALAPDGVSVVRVRLVSDDAGFSADVHMPPALAGGFAPFTPRLPTMLAAAGMDPSYAWWSIAPSDVRSALEGLPSPLARAARTVTGEALVIAAEAPARAELLLGIDDPGPTLGAFGMLSLAGTFGLDIAAILPGWSWRLAKVPAFDQQFEVLSLERAAPHEAPLAAEGALEGASWDDAERGFVTPTVDALWVALGASLEELDASPLAARHGLRLERGVSAAPLPPRAKADLAAGRVGALASLDVFALLDPRAVAATRRLWRTFDAPSERAWGELLGSATRVVRSQLSPAARLVVWSCPAVRAASPAAALSPAVASAIPSTGPSAGAAARALASNAGESLHVHVELCLACGADDAASIEGGAGVDRDWRTPARALAAMAASYAALLALTKPH
jgi:hypothetical protein